MTVEWNASWISSSEEAADNSEGGSSEEVDTNESQSLSHAYWKNSFSIKKE